MLIMEEKRLCDFEFWSGARYVANKLSVEELDEIEAVIEDLEPEGVDAVWLNDLFWFEPDYIASILGYGSWEELEEDRAA